MDITFAMESNSVFNVSQLEGICTYICKNVVHNNKLMVLFFIFYIVFNYSSYHLPWGVPQGIDDNEVCVLTHPYYIIKYSTFYHIPLWVAYKLEESVRKTHIYTT